MDCISGCRLGRDEGLTKTTDGLQNSKIKVGIKYEKSSLLRLGFYILVISNLSLAKYAVRIHIIIIQIVLFKNRSG